MNESYPSHSAPQQNPMKHCQLHRVALMHPVTHIRIIGISMGVPMPNLDFIPSGTIAGLAKNPQIFDGA